MTTIPVLLETKVPIQFPVLAPLPKPSGWQIDPGKLVWTLALVTLASLGHGVSWVYPGIWSGAWIGAWIGQAALILLAVQHPPRRAFWLALLVGLVVNGWSFHWAPHALEVCMDAQWWLSYLLFGMLVFWEGLAFGLFAGMVFWATRRGSQGLWLIPVAWVVTEHWWPRVFPWLLGYSQLEVLPLIQIADLTGSCGIGFCVTALCALPAAWDVYRRNQERPAELRWFAGYCLATASLLLAVSGYGYFQMHHWSTPTIADRTLKLGIIQVNIGQVGSEEKLLEITRRIAKGVDLVCWPESAIGIYCSDLTHFRDPQQTLLQSRESQKCLRPTESTHCQILAGGKTFQANAPEVGPYSMTAFLIDPQESICSTYQKRTLIPFGEYMPGQEYFPALREWATLQTMIEPGKSTSPLIATNGAKLGVIICYEDLVRANVLAIARSGGEVIISLINDGAFEHPLTLEQHRRLSVMRAVEHRRYFVRCAGTGVTCVVAPTGKIVAELPIGTEDSLVETITLSNYQTVYTRYGEWFPMLCTVLLSLSLLPWRKPKSLAPAVPTQQS